MSRTAVHTDSLTRDTARLTEVLGETSRKLLGQSRQLRAAPARFRVLRHDLSLHVGPLPGGEERLLAAP